MADLNNYFCPVEFKHDGYFRFDFAQITQGGRKDSLKTSLASNFVSKMNKDTEIKALNTVKFIIRGDGERFLFLRKGSTVRSKERHSNLVTKVCSQFSIITSALLVLLNLISKPISHNESIEQMKRFELGAVDLNVNFLSRNFGKDLDEAASILSSSQEKNSWFDLAVQD